MDALLTGRVVLASVLLQEAKPPQAGMEQLVAALQRKEQQNKATKKCGFNQQGRPGCAQRVVLDNVTWLDSRRQCNDCGRELALGNDLLPDHVQAKGGAGRFAGTQATCSASRPAAGNSRQPWAGPLSMARWT